MERTNVLRTFLFVLDLRKPFPLKVGFYFVPFSSNLSVQIGNCINIRVVLIILPRRDSKVNIFLGDSGRMFMCAFSKPPNGIIYDCTMRHVTLCDICRSNITFLFAVMTVSMIVIKEHCYINYIDVYNTKMRVFDTASSSTRV